MRKPLYNIVIFIFHIITLILLFTLCIHFNVIKLDFLDFSKEAVASFFKNDYVVNIVCTILTVAALYIIQIKYSKHKLKSDFRCNEIIHDVYDGIVTRVRITTQAVAVMLRFHDVAVVLCPAAADFATAGITETLHSEAAFQHTLPQRVHDLLQLQLECGAVQLLRAAGPPCMPELVAAASEVHPDMSNGTQPLIFFGVRGIK